MRHEIRYFLENTKDEEVISFILGNLTESGIEQIFELLNDCTEESDTRWNKFYENMLNKAIKK